MSLRKPPFRNVAGGSVSRAHCSTAPLVSLTSMWTHTCGFTHSTFEMTPCNVSGLPSSNCEASEWCADGLAPPSSAPTIPTASTVMTRYVIGLPQALKRITEKRQHAAKENDADPEKERSAREHLGRDRSVIVRLERLNPICHAAHVKQENVPTGEDEKKHLKTKRRVVNVLKRLANEEHGTGHQVDQESKHSPSHEC